MIFYYYLFSIQGLQSDSATISQVSVQDIHFGFCCYVCFIFLSDQEKELCIFIALLFLDFQVLYFTTPFIIPK